MQKPYLLSFCSVFGILAALAGCSGSASQGPAAGTRPMSFSSSGLARAVVGQVWYPAEAGSAERTVYYSSMVWGRAAPGARALATQAPRPLILLAHGWRGTRFDLSWLGEALARQGYVAASINMPSSDAQTFEDAQAPKTWFRANLLSKFVDAIAADPFLRGLTDTQRVAVIGHSAGGSTALMLGGATLDPDRFAQLFPAAAPVVEGDWRDPRVKALVALNPGTGPAFSPEGLARVHVPVLILSGSGDQVAPESQNAGFYAANIEKASWMRFAGVDHYSFMPVCSAWGMLRRFGACIESHAEVDRAYVHNQTLQRVEGFLGQTLPLDRARQLTSPWPSLVPSLSPVAVSKAAAPLDR